MVKEYKEFLREMIIYSNLLSHAGLNFETLAYMEENHNKNFERFKYQLPVVEKGVAEDLSILLKNLQQKEFEYELSNFIDKYTKSIRKIIEENTSTSEKELSKLIKIPMEMFKEEEKIFIERFGEKYTKEPMVIKFQEMYNML